MVALFLRPSLRVRFFSLAKRNRRQARQQLAAIFTSLGLKADRKKGEEARMYRGLIAAAGLSTRLQDLSEKRNKVLLDLGGETILGTILSNFEAAGIAPPL